MTTLSKPQRELLGFIRDRNMVAIPLDEGSYLLEQGLIEPVLEDPKCKIYRITAKGLEALNDK